MLGLGDTSLLEDLRAWVFVVASEAKASWR